ncbi:MAG: hypothetical protein ACI4EX_10065 [Lachnospiraceae bacterium]
MAKEEKNTSEVEKLLNEMKPHQLKDFYKENSASMVNADKAFYYYMKDVLEAKNIRLKDIYIGIGESESYGEKILRMEKHTSDRDLILRMCIVGHFTVDETNKALKLYEMRPLYAKDKRDACIMVAIHNRIYELLDIDEMLEKQGFLKLSKDIKK